LAPFVVGSNMLICHGSIHKLMLVHVVLQWQEIKPRPGSMWPSARSGFQFFVNQDEVSDLEMQFMLLFCIVNLPYFDQDVLPRLWAYNYPSFHVPILI
jgi:hypothetical protein